MSIIDDRSTQDFLTYANSVIKSRAIPRVEDNLKPIQYELIQSPDNKIHYGFVAQDVEATLSDAGVNPDEIGIIGHIQNHGKQEYVLTYTEFIPLLTKKCQELQAETNMLKQEIAQLKTTIESLQK